MLALSLGIWMVSLSVVAMTGYMADKTAARTERWRVSEKTLLLLSVAGGWPGAFLGQRLLHHKRALGPYQVKLRVAAVVNVALLLCSIAALRPITFGQGLWLYAQCWGYVQSHPAEVLGTVTGIAGAFVMSLNNRRSRLAWPIWIVSNVSWVDYALALSPVGWGMVVLQSIFAAINVFGAWTWLIAPMLRRNGLRVNTGPTH